VPLEDRLARAEAGEEGARPPGLGEVEIVPPDLLLWAGEHLPAQGPGHELRPETDAQDRHLSLDGFADEIHLVAKVGVAVRLVDIHRSAKDDEPIVPPEPRSRRREASEVHVADAEAGLAKQGIEDPQRLVGDVLADQDLRHRSA